MGSSLFPIIADFVLQDLKTRAINTLPTRLPIYYRYVNNIFFMCPPDILNNVLEIFNSLHKCIQFTLEVGKSNRLQFLNVTAIIANKKNYFWFI